MATANAKQAQVEQHNTKKAGRAIQQHSVYSEDPKAQYLFTGTDEHGREVYFFQMDVTGLRKRIFGPYSTRAKAIRCFDEVLSSVHEAFCEIQNMERFKNSGMEHIELPKDLFPAES